MGVGAGAADAEGEELIGVSTIVEAGVAAVSVV